MNTKNSRNKNNKNNKNIDNGSGRISTKRQQMLRTQTQHWHTRTLLCKVVDKALGCSLVRLVLPGGLLVIWVPTSLAGGRVAAAISLVAMSTRSRGSLVKLAVLALLVMFGFVLLLLSALHNSDMEFQQQLVVQHTVNVSRSPVPPLVVPSLVKVVAAPAMQQSVEPVDEELVLRLESELPEVDYDFWYRLAKPFKYQMESDCARYPDPLELQLHNTYWQTFINANVTFRLYAAYWDDRKGVAVPGQGKAVVRILATANQIGDEFPPTQCQFWYEGYPMPVLTNVSEYLSIWVKSWASKPRLSYPHLVICPIPDALPPTYEDVVPRTVSLVREACEHASNSLRIHNDRPAAKVQVAETTGSVARQPLSFGVCVKGFDFPYVDLSERLIEWFELQRLLGASRIYAYMYDVHPSVQRVLDYYQRSGFLELRPLTMANGMPRLRHYQHMLLQKRRLIKRLNELIPYNDCFYRNMYRHDYLLNVDIDEVVMPVGAMRTWQEIFDTDQKITMPCANGFVSMCFINSYFTKVVPEMQNHEQQEADELYVLQHTMRYRNYSMPHRATKCFHNSRYSLTLHNHFTLKWISGVCAPRSIDIHLAQMQHYREPDNNYELADLVEDRNAWKYATELRAAVEHVWMHMDDGLEQSVVTAEDLNMLSESREQESYQEQAQEQQQVLQQAQVLRV